MKEAQMKIDVAGERGSKIVTTIFLVLMTLALLVVAYRSLEWKIMHDSPIMLYVAMLIDVFDRIPYRDIFEMNMPGTLFLYYLIGHFTNYTDLGFRIADLLFLGAISATTWVILRQIGKHAAWGAIVAFGLVYFSWGPGNSLQRDYMLILPVSTALMLTVALPKLNHTIRCFLVGVLGSIAFLIKPHSVILFMAIAGFEYYKIRKNGESFKNVIKIIALYGIGFSIPTSITVLYLWYHNALSDFIDIIRNYFPLYSHLNGKLTTIYGTAKLKYLISEYFKFGSNWGTGSLALWLIPACAGGIIGWSHKNRQKKEIIVLLAVLSGIASLYPALSGQFFLYHYFLYIYFIILLSSLCFTEFSNANRYIKPIPLVLFLVVFLSKMSILPQILTFGEQPLAFVEDVSATFRSLPMKPGDTIQPLDWTAGVVNAMLRTKLPISTPFTCDFQFYHDISNPYIQNLRKEFVLSIEENKPKYIVSVKPEFKPSVSGENTTVSFTELEEIIKTKYVPVRWNETVTFYERK